MGQHNYQPISVALVADWLDPRTNGRGASRSTANGGAGTVPHVYRQLGDCEYLMVSLEKPGTGGENVYLRGVRTKHPDLAPSLGADTVKLSSATPGDLAFAKKCADLHRFICPLLHLLQGLKAGRFDKGLTSFQQSVALDRLQRILGILQKPEMGEKYLHNLLQIEGMLKLWFPHVALEPRVTVIQSITPRMSPHWCQSQRHMPVKVPPAMAAGAVGASGGPFDSTVERKFLNVTNTMDSIQGLSTWCIENKKYHSLIVRHWIKCLKKSDSSHKLNLFYLANDVIQNCKRKNAIVYRTAFADVLPEAFLQINCDGDAKVSKSVERILSIWEERSVYSGALITELRNSLVKEESPPETPVEQKTPVESKADLRSKIVAEFVPQALLDLLCKYKRSLEEVDLREKQLAAMRVDICSSEALKKLKDKAGGKKFSKDFEEGSAQLQEFVKFFDKQNKVGPPLLEALSNADIFYEMQYNEVKIVANAYQTFANRVSNLKRKLDNLKATLPDLDESPIPSPSADAPSPTGSESPFHDLELANPDPDLDGSAMDDDAEPPAPSPLSSPGGSPKHIVSLGDNDNREVEDMDLSEEEMDSANIIVEKLECPAQSKVSLPVSANAKPSVAAVQPVPHAAPPVAAPAASLDGVDLGKIGSSVRQNTNSQMPPQTNPASALVQALHRDMDLAKEQEPEKPESLESKIHSFLHHNPAFSNFDFGFSSNPAAGGENLSPVTGADTQDGTPVRDEGGGTPTQDEMMDKPAGIPTPSSTHPSSIAETVKPAPIPLQNSTQLNLEIPLPQAHLQLGVAQNGQVYQQYSYSNQDRSEHGVATAVAHYQTMSTQSGGPVPGERPPGNVSGSQTVEGFQGSDRGWYGETYPEGAFQQHTGYNMTRAGGASENTKSAHYPYQAEQSQEPQEVAAQQGATLSSGFYTEGLPPVPELPPPPECFGNNASAVSSTMRLPGQQPVPRTDIGEVGRSVISGMVVHEHGHKSVFHPEDPQYDLSRHHHVDLHPRMDNLGYQEDLDHYHDELHGHDTLHFPDDRLSHPDDPYHQPGTPPPNYPRIRGRLTPPLSPSEDPYYTHDYQRQSPPHPHFGPRRPPPHLEIRHPGLRPPQRPPHGPPQRPPHGPPQRPLQRPPHGPLHRPPHGPSHAPLHGPPHRPPHRPLHRPPPPPHHHPPRGPLRAPFPRFPGPDPRLRGKHPGPRGGGPMFPPKRPFLPPRY
ncbi:regulation of nuclear pre-mRNA domain-containing protein 2a [Aulostomus maculatus]